MVLREPSGIVLRLPLHSLYTMPQSFSLPLPRRDTSGVLVLAKTAEAVKGLASEFSSGAAQKEYIALCWETAAVAPESDHGDSRESLSGDERGQKWEPCAPLGCLLELSSSPAQEYCLQTGHGRSAGVRETTL